MIIKGYRELIVGAEYFSHHIGAIITIERTYESSEIKWYCYKVIKLVKKPTWMKEEVGLEKKFPEKCAFHCDLVSYSKLARKLNNL